METRKSSIPPAIIKLNKDIARVERIVVPTKAKINRSIATVIIVEFEIDFFCFFSILLVSAIITGMHANGSITTNKVMIALGRSSKILETIMLEKNQTMNYSLRRREIYYIT